MATYTLIGGDQKQYGPVGADDVRRWIADGRLNGQSLMREETDTEFRPLSTFPEFADALAPKTAGVPGAAAPPVDWRERDYELDIGGCINRGWEVVKNNFWPAVGITALVLLIVVVVNQFVGLFTRPIIQGIMLEHRITVGGAVFLLLMILASGPIYTIIMAGLFKYYLKLIRGENPGIGDAFSGFGPSIGQLILLSLALNILTLVGYVLCVVPGIYLAVAWFFSIPLVIDRQLHFWEAMELSRRMVNKHWFLVLAFLVVYAVLSMAGVLACCIGILVTVPISIAALMYAYETIFSDRAKAA